jgi:NAD(P)-dependent dehydrogenase (short-subunit alcohol dehydrogenase family)
MTHGLNSSLSQDRQSGRLSLSGKVAIVTGAGSGIGRAAALAYAHKGASVVLAGRREPELRVTADKITSRGGKAAVIPTDITDETAIANLVAGAVEHFGRVHIAFNNAGTASYNPIEHASVAEFDRVVATNVRGVWLLLKSEIAVMRAAGNGGAIVNTSSASASSGVAGLSAYAASKAAIDAMTRVLALETGADAIRINCVSPGVIKSPLTESLSEASLSTFAAHAALQRLGDAAEIADVAVWLSTDEARFITGQSIVVDGGFNIAGVR